MRDIKSVLPSYNPFNPPENFVRWVLSITDSFRDRIRYHAFEEYKLQASEWIDENERLEGYKNEDSQMEFAARERLKMRFNSLYYLNKYHHYKDSESLSGVYKTIASPSQEVLAFLMDIGCCQFISKARYVRSSTTLLGIAGLKIRIFNNLNCKYVIGSAGNSEEKAQSLFNEKVRIPTDHDPAWMQMKPLYDTKKGFTYGRKGSDGGRKGTLSSLDIKVATLDVFNAENPDMILVDEAPTIPVFDRMMTEGRPALFKDDPVTMEKRMAKQVIAWGTSHHDKDSSVQLSEAFENEFKTLLQAYRDGIFSDGIVPLFFDMWANPGMTDDIYQREYQVAEKTGKKYVMSQFRKNYPRNIEDAFLKTYDTIIPYEDISEYHERINELIKKEQLTLERGRFRPIFNTKKPIDNWISPYEIIGAEWIVSRPGDTDYTATIFLHPHKGWNYRYYQGTDPIFSESGHSKGASAIWDERDKTISAYVNCRPDDYRLFYEQAYCMHLYYSDLDRQFFPYELLEINIGGGYKDYCEKMRLGYNLINRLELPEYLQHGQHITGIRKTSANAGLVANATKDMLLMYGDKLFIDDLWIQLKTYIPQAYKNGLGHGRSPADPKYNFDDLIDACTFAYIASLCFEGMIPRQVKVDDMGRRRETQLVFENGFNVYKEVVVKI